LNHPLISVLIPTYNRARFIRETVDSALVQDYDRFEVVVVDDGSTDDTAGIVNSYDDPRVRYVQAGHGGVARARNRGVKEARGEFLLWLDSDDMLHEGAIGSYVAALDEHPDADIVYGQWDIIDDEGNRTGARRFDGFTGRDMFHQLLEGCVVPQPGCFVRRRCYDVVGMYDTSLEVAEDYDFFARAVGRCRFLALDQTLYAYRDHGDQLCGAGNVTDKRCERVVVSRMIEQHGYRKLCPDLYEQQTADRRPQTADREIGENRAEEGRQEATVEADIASMFRLAAVFHERNGPEEREEMFRKAVSEVRQRTEGGKEGAQEIVVREAGELLCRVGMTDRKTYRSYAFVCTGLWPTRREMLKHVVLSLLPGWLHRRLRGRKYETA